MLAKISFLCFVTLVNAYSTFRQFATNPFSKLIPLGNAISSYDFRRLHSEKLFCNIQHAFCPISNYPLTFTGRNICCHEAQAIIFFRKEHQKTVMLIFQKLLIHSSTRSNNLNYLAFNNAFSFFRVLHLLTNCNAITLLHQFGNVTIHRMVRHTAHWHILLALSQSNIQFARRSNCILKKHFVKIAQTEEQ